MDTAKDFYFFFHYLLIYYLSSLHICYFLNTYEFYIFFFFRFFTTFYGTFTSYYPNTFIFLLCMSIPLLCIIKYFKSKSHCLHTMTCTMQILWKRHTQVVNKYLLWVHSSMPINWYALVIVQPYHFNKHSSIPIRLLPSSNEDQGLYYHVLSSWYYQASCLFSS